MTEQRLVRIRQPKEGFSKKQKEFNLLSGKIEELGAQWDDLKQATDLFRERYLQELLPLHHIYFQSYQVLVINLDHAYGSGWFSNTEKTQIGMLIASYSQYLLRQTEASEIKAIWEKYHIYAPVEKENDQRRKIEAHDSESISDNNNLGTTSAASARNLGHDWSLEQKLHDRAKMEQGLTKAAVRKIYLSLVKEYHPDRELDEELKQAKTTMMQQITRAFAQDDLHQLLHLQLQLESGLQKDPEKLSSKALNHYIKGFKSQILQLEEEIVRQKETLALICQIEVVHTHHLHAVSIQFQTNVKQAKAEIKNVRAFAKAIQDPSILRAHLATI